MHWHVSVIRRSVLFPETFFDLIFRDILETAFTLLLAYLCIYKNMKQQLSFKKEDIPFLYPKLSNLLIFFYLKE